MTKARIVIGGYYSSKAAFDAARNDLGKLKGQVDTLNQSFGSMASIFGAAFAGVSFGAFLKSTLEGIDNLNDLKDATGESIEKLSALEDIALRTGTSMDTASDAVIKLNKALYDAQRDPSSTAGRAVKGLGLDIKELLALPLVERLQAVGRALNSFDDQGKLEYSLALTGRAAREIMPWLKDLAEAGKLNATITTEQAEEAEKMRKEFFQLEKSALDLSRTLMLPLVASMNETIKKFREARAAGKSYFEIFVDQQREFLGLGKPKNTGGATGSWGEPDKPKLPALAPEAPKPTFKPTRRGAAGEADDASRALASYVEALSRAATAEEKLSETQKAQDFLRGLGRMGEVQQVRELVIGLAEEADMRALVAQQAKADDADREEVARRQKERQEQLNALIAATPTAKLEETRQAMQLLADAFDAGTISAEQFAEAAQTRLGNVAPEVKERVDEMAVFANQAARNIQDSLGNTIEATLLGKFDSIGDMWKNLLVRMASEAAAAQIGKELFGDFGSTGKMGGSIGSLLQYLPMLFSGSGNVFAGGVHAFATGGILGPNGGLLTKPTIFPMARGGIGIGGEAGTEAVMPLLRTRDGKLGVQAQGGAGQTVVMQLTNNVRIDSRTDAAVVGQLVAQGVQEGQRQMLDYLRAGGVLQ